MMTLPLSDIVSIRTGFQFRGEAPYSPHGKYSLVHLKDSADALTFDEQEIHHFDISEIKKEDLLAKNDILLRSKGNNHFSVLVDREVSNTVVSGLSLVIRCKDSRVAPSYLAWYLNQPPAQSFLTKISAGTSISVVNKGALGDLAIPLRPLTSQDAIGELYQLQLRKECLTMQLLKSSRKLLNAKLLSIETNISTEAIR
jgi:restriction endonuclease S subunit